MHIRSIPPCARARLGALLLAGTAAAAAPLHAQVPLAPSPVLNLGHLAVTPAWSGYIAGRQTRRRDSTTFSLSRIRLTMQDRVLPSIAVRVQGGISNSGIGGSAASVGRFAFSDAYVQYSPTSDNAGIRALRPSVIVGQFKMPFSLEYLTPYSHLETVQRSQAVNDIGIKRDIGVMGQLHLARYAILDAALANGSGSNTTSNPDGQELAMGRLTVLPLPYLALAAKWAGQGADHHWGYDARLMTHGAVVEGEVIQRRHPADGGEATGSGGYTLASYTLLSWLQPVLKWERLDENADEVGGGASTRSTWMTYGMNVVAPHDRVRLQLDWVVKSDHPVDHANELLAQVLAIF
ncbi:MAG TPA: porin [Gemmatimonadaceae bacterium]|nr:porin [Gemmatimonadaceae bacterium]